MLDDQTPVLLIQKQPLNAYYNENTASVAAYPNPNLKWEKTSSFNLGLNFSLLERRIQFEGEYYYKRTKDAFMTKEVASMNGVDSYVINGGDIENKGYSVDVTVLPVKRQDWLWSVSASFSKDMNNVNSDPDAQTYDYQDFLNGTVVVKGEAVNTFYSYEFLGLSPVDDDAATAGSGPADMPEEEGPVVISADLGRSYQRTHPESWRVTAGLFRQTFERGPRVLTRLYEENELAGLCRLGQTLEKAAPCLGAERLSETARAMQTALNDPQCETQATAVENCSVALREVLTALGTPQNVK